MSAIAAARSIAGAARGELGRHLVGAATRGLRGHVRSEVGRERRHRQRAGRASNPMLRAGQAGADVVNVMLVIVIAAVVGYVGIKAGSETEDSITDTNLQDTNAENQTQFENATESITGGFGSAMDLTEVVFIVLMLSVIIAVLVGLRGRR